MLIVTFRTHSTFPMKLMALHPITLLPTLTPLLVASVAQLRSHLLCVWVEFVVTCSTSSLHPLVHPLLASL